MAEKLANALTRLIPAKCNLRPRIPGNRVHSALQDPFKPSKNTRVSIADAKSSGPSHVPKSKKLAAQRFSRAVPHLSTNRALSCLTSEFGWDPVHLAQYGRQRNPTPAIRLYMPCQLHKSATTKPLLLNEASKCTHCLLSRCSCNLYTHCAHHAPKLSILRMICSRIAYLSTVARE